MISSNIERLAAVCERSLFYRDGKLSYPRLIAALQNLGSVVAGSDTDDTTWGISKRGAACLDDIIVGSYWFCADYHVGQTSPEYALLCTMGRIFSPCMADGPEPDSVEADVYSALETMHAAYYGGDA